MEPKALVSELWRRIQARRWDDVERLLADDFTLQWPDSRLVLRGRANFVEFNRTYPEGWSIEVLRIVAEGNTAVSEVRVPHATLGPFYAISFFEAEGNRLTGAREYWLTEHSEEPAPERAQWFQRME
jgi:hypothetical protein